MDRELPKERPGLARPLCLYIALAIPGAGGNLAEKVTLCVHLGHAEECVGGGSAGAQLAVEMSHCLAEVLVDLSDRIWLPATSQ